MKERPIIFNSDEVRAILEGRKTMMRKPVKNKEILSYLGLNKIKERVTAISCEDFTHDISEICPYGVPGDRLWVKETWRLPYGGPNRWVDYRADDARDGFKWRSPVHMPRWASRITLEIINVHVERLQDISEEDAKAEGVAWVGLGRLGCKLGDGSYREGFSFTWDSIAKRGYGWYADPWVWVIEFKREEATR